MDQEYREKLDARANWTEEQSAKAAMDAMVPHIQRYNESIGGDSSESAARAEALAACNRVKQKQKVDGEA